MLGYLSTRSRSETDAAEVFSSFCEDPWKGLPGSRWPSSFRTWAYTLARHALDRMARDPQRRRDRNVALSDLPEVFELAEQARTTTLIHLRTETKNKLTALRDQLEPDDRTLLILRVDRKLAWSEIASVMADEDEPTPEEIQRGAATLRKRFERAPSQACNRAAADFRLKVARSNGPSRCAKAFLYGRSNARRPTLGRTIGGRVVRFEVALDSIPRIG